MGRADGTVVDERRKCPPVGKSKCPLGLPVDPKMNGTDASCEKCLGINKLMLIFIIFRLWNL